MIVIDASAVVELLLGSETGRSLIERVLTPWETLHAPHLVDVEVAHAVRRHDLGGALGETRATTVLRDLRLLPLHRYGHSELLERVWELRHRLTAYDACYVALAETLDAPLITCDAALARAGGHSAEVELILRQ
jgi:predicted nucleic acid-binding protein